MVQTSTHIKELDLKKNIAVIRQVVVVIVVVSILVRPLCPHRVEEKLLISWASIRSFPRPRDAIVTNEALLRDFLIPKMVHNLRGDDCILGGGVVPRRYP